MMSTPKKISDVPPMSDDELEEFWDNNQPEDFEGWREGELKFKRLPKKLIQLRLDPGHIQYDFFSTTTDLLVEHLRQGYIRPQGDHPIDNQNRYIVHIVDLNLHSRFSLLVAQTEFSKPTLIGTRVKIKGPLDPSSS